MSGREVYVAWAVDDTCLYVGCAGSARWRIYQHYFEAPWVSQVAYWTATIPLHHRLAPVLERVLIRRLWPIFNQVSHPSRTKPETLRAAVRKLRPEQRRAMAGAYLSMHRLSDEEFKKPRTAGAVA